VLRSQRGGALSIGAVLALWAASNGVGTLMKALNRAYGVEETRNFVVKKALAVGLTLVLSVLLISGFILLLMGGFIGDWLSARFGLGGFFQLTWSIVRIVGVLGGISLSMALLYWKGPNVDQQFQWITPGSIITTLLWAGATIGFGLYVQFLGASSYSKTYGTAFGLMLFMFYLYLTSNVVLLGAELNAETAKRYDPKTIKDKVTDPAKQLPGEQPAPHPQAAAEAGVSRQRVVATNATSATKVAAGRGGPETATARTTPAAESSASVGTGGGEESRRDGHDARDAHAREGRAGSAQPALAVVGGERDAHSSDEGEPQPQPGPRLEADADKTGPDRTKIATLAVTAASVAGAVAIGALHGNSEKKAA
jgi:membrane protein